MKESNITEKNIQEMDRIFRLNLVNSLPGFKSANLLGTSNLSQQYNLAIFSSVIHLGSDPALLGFILRPVTVNRHTYENILKTRFYTINHIHESFVNKAHQTSAKYPEEVSEFDQVGLTPETWKDHPPPFVKESMIKIGMEYLEEYDIRANGTKLIVGKIKEIRLPSTIQHPDGTLDLSKAGTVTISGLNTYHRTRKIAVFDYARP
jgi:flavin reductase (DIM6/NTAB) family NADH-FMN oxidoreductase RutF